MRILDWDSLSERERNAALARPSMESRSDIAAVALEVINTVRQKGDEALRAYTERFDGVKLESLAVSREEFGGPEGAFRRAVRRPRACHRQCQPLPRGAAAEALCDGHYARGAL